MDINGKPSVRLEAPDGTPSVAILTIPVKAMPKAIVMWPKDVLVLGSVECVTDDESVAFYVCSPAWRKEPWPKDGSPRFAKIQTIDGPGTTGMRIVLEPLKSLLQGLGGEPLGRA